MSIESKHKSEAVDDPRRSLVNRVVRSDTFARAPRLAEFLTFVSERTLTGQVSSINEQEIGVKVFGREAGYLQSDDNIVRVNASRLRQRLEEYFSTEGANETLRIALPKGRYIPEFLEVPQTRLNSEPHMVPLESSLLQTTSSETYPKRISRTVFFLITAALIVVVGVVFATLRAKSLKSARSGAAISGESFFTPFLSGDAATLVVPSDSSLIIYDRLTHSTVGLSEYMSGSYRTAKSAGDEDKAEARSMAQRRTVSTADLAFVTTLQRMSDAANGQMKVVFARDLNMQELQNSNAVLLGARAANPWVALYDSERHFSLIADEGTRVYTIRNRTPSKGDFDVLQYQAKDPQYLAYALVAYLPNQDKKHSVLILEGTLESGTQAAIDFVFNSKQLNDLLSTHRRSDGTIPYFEFVLECDAFSRKSPSARIVAQRYF